MSHEKVPIENLKLFLECTLRESSVNEKNFSHFPLPFHGFLFSSLWIDILHLFITWVFISWGPLLLFPWKLYLLHLLPNKSLFLRFTWRYQDSLLLSFPQYGEHTRASTLVIKSSLVFQSSKLRMFSSLSILYLTYFYFSSPNRKTVIISLKQHDLNIKTTKKIS